MFALELTVGVSWAIPLDIGGDYAGSVAAVMNTSGNLGGATGSALSAYLVMLYGWNGPFLVMSILSVIAALLYLRMRCELPYLCTAEAKSESRVRSLSGPCKIGTVSSTSRGPYFNSACCLQYKWHRSYS